MTPLAALLLVGACKQKPEGAAPAAGSATTTASVGDAGAPSDVARTPDELAKRYEDCVRFASEAKWDDYRGCYAPDAKFETPGLGEPQSLDAQLAVARAEREAVIDYRSEPQLVLVSGSTVIAILRVTGTHAPSKRPVGVFLGHIVDADASGRFTRDRAFFDARTLEGQITGATDVRAVPAPFPTKTAVIAKGTPTEQANLGVLATMTAAYDKRDVAALAGIFADELVWSPQARPADVDKAKVLATFQGVWARVPDIRYATEAAWAAGDYVATIERGTGTLPARGSAAARPLDIPLFAVHRFENGKIAHGWVFFQRAAADGR